VTRPPFIASERRSRRTAGAESVADALRADIAIVGFGYAGLASLLHLVRVGERQRVVVVAHDTSGLGLAYGTSEAEHLLNVPAERMGAVAGDPENFASWLVTAAAANAAAVIGARLPGPLDYPRALYGSYLASLHDHIEVQAQEREISIAWLSADAEDLDRGANGWEITAGRRVIEADACVLAIGNERRRVFGDLEHPALHPGAWTPATAEPLGAEQPVALSGSGLTAVDSIVSLRSAGYRGEILALSRSGRFPAAHRPGVEALALDSADVDAIHTLEDVLVYFREQDRAGHDWRAAIDGLRPHTQQIWKRLSPADQKAAIARWSSVWSVRRHRMAVEVAERINR